MVLAEMCNVGEDSKILALAIGVLPNVRSHVAAIGAEPKRGKSRPCAVTGWA